MGTMRKGYVFFVMLFIAFKLPAQYSLTLVPYSQDFNGLGTASSTPAGGDLNIVSTTLNGWYFSEALANANNTITAGTGSSGTGDTYNFGLAAAADRTLGGLQSANLNPTIGFYVTNNTGSTITSLTIGYTGEQWRLGTAGRVDRIDFQYSQNATSLITGNWIDVDALDFTAPVTTIPLGALDGNLAANRTLVSSTIIGLYIPNGTTFFIRWIDFDASGAEDGLGIDDFSLTAGIVPPSTNYFRSGQSGSWTNLLTWESSSDNITFVPATAIPNSAANTISIRNGHTVTFSAFLPLDQVIIQSGGTLNFSTGILTVEDGSGDDIDIQGSGALVLSSANNPPAFSGVSPTVNVQSSGILRVSASGLTLTPAAGVHAANYVYNHQSILEHTLTTAFGTVGVTYFPNVTASVIPIFRITQNIGVFVGSTSPTIVNGVFEANGNINFTASGTKTFRNGIRGTGNIGESSSGLFVISGLTAELGGTGSLTVPTTGGLEIGSASGTTVSVTSNKTVTGDISLISTNTYVDLGGNNLTVSGTITGGGANAYIRTSGAGSLIHTAVTTKTFPIGNTSYNPLVISNGNSADFTARVENGINPGIAFPTFGINRTWSIHASAVTPNVGVVFQYATADANAGALPQAQPMEILQNTGGVWSILSGNTNINPGGADPAWTVTAATALGINNSATPYAIGKSGGFTLPIDCIISCQSKKINSGGIITWNINTCAEVNSFEVQRSFSGGAFHTIGTIIPGTSLNYSHIDPLLEKGTSLYRVKVNRSSGAIKYSNSVAIINDSKGILITAILPNPVSDNATLVINGAKTGLVNFIIYDLSGRPVKQWSANISEGSNSINVNARELPAGIYHLAATTGDAKTVIRFVKQ